MKIVIAGDLVPTQSNIKWFIEGNILQLMGEELVNIWKDADIRLFNLEAPITGYEKKIRKSGPNIKIDTRAIDGIKALEPTLITLANNHIMDYGVQGLKDTISWLSKSNIPYLGVGKNIYEAKKPIIIEKEIKVGIYACVENEFASASEECAGANPVDYLEMFDDIKQLKEKCNYLIVLYHGGKEYYRYPSPMLQRVCHKMADSGADLIICQHTHCIGCEENYCRSKIIYGQGNFVFDGGEDEFWNEGMLIKIDLLETKEGIMYYPFEKNQGMIRLAGKEKGEKILSKYKERTKEITNIKFLKETYKQFAKEKSISYMRTIHGYNWRAQLKNKLLGKSVDMAYSDEEYLAIQNIIECEAHRELFLQYLKERK